ncbi:MAG: hypothetical protein HZA72_00515 [Candidatus Omnitrophica bacterium]|nr:hypothetical protein [Candidatus Omnitrophota bacterium]
MKRLFVVLLSVFFVMSLITGCGQKQEGEKKPLVIKPEGASTENIDENEVDVEEEADLEEAPVKVEGEAPNVSEEPKAAEELIIADFNSGVKPSNIGGNFGAWNKDPSDPTQWCRESFDNAARHGDSGFGMKLDYSVDSPNPAYNGFWMMLPNFDAVNFDNIAFWVKGDTNAGYTTVFKIELKNANKQVGRYYISNVSDQWQNISIPLSELKGLIDRSNLTEFVVVFEDRMATNKKGVIYIDDIKFTKNK